MNKIPVLILLFLCTFLTANAQRYADLEATLLSPLNNDTAFIDESFDIVLQVINNGVDTFRATDSAQFVLEFDGSPILFSVGGGPSLPYLPYSGAEIVPGDTALVGFSFTLFSGWDLGTTQFCARFIPYNATDSITDTVLTNNGGCANILIYEYGTGISAFTELDKSITVYPNPARDIIHIKAIATKTEHIMFSLVNIMGQTVLKQDLGLKSAGEVDVPVNLNNIPRGVYGYQLIIGSEIKKGKLMVE